MNAYPTDFAASIRICRVEAGATNHHSLNWREKAESARRVRRRISQVLEWARAARLRFGDNPVDLVKPGAGLSKLRDRVQHFKALPFADLPGLWPRLADAPVMGAAALRFAILRAIPPAGSFVRLSQKPRLRRRKLKRSQMA